MKAEPAVTVPCRHCERAVMRRRGHWIDAYGYTPDGQSFSRARTCGASPVMAKLHAPSA